jgi:hypothetical protein
MVVEGLEVVVVDHRGGDSGPCSVDKGHMNARIGGRRWTCGARSTFWIEVHMFEPNLDVRR